MDQATVQLIIALLPIAEKLVFEVGGKMIEICTKDLKTPEQVTAALKASLAEGFPQLSFKTPA